VKPIAAPLVLFVLNTTGGHAADQRRTVPALLEIAWTSPGTILLIAAVLVIVLLFMRRRRKSRT
jgi:NhaP-type Na+/H+ or K+/H+ antiporter